MPAQKLGLGSCLVLVDLHGPAVGMSRLPYSSSVSELSPSGDVAAVAALPAAAGPPVAAAIP